MTDFKKLCILRDYYVSFFWKGCTSDMSFTIEKKTYKGRHSGMITSTTFLNEDQSIDFLIQIL